MIKPSTVEDMTQTIVRLEEAAKPERAFRMP